VPAALLAGLVAIAAVVVLSLGGNGRESTSTGGGAGGGDGAASGTGGGGSGAGASRDPAGTVKAFYDRAAADDYTGAWALAAPSFRQQLGGFDSFQRTMSTLESIDFKRDETFGESGDTAGVSIETVAHHRNRVDHCQGTLGLTRAGAGGWLISGASISCSTEGGAGGD
jgi:hypothetical protein